MFKISFITYIILQKIITSIVKFNFMTNKAIIPNLDFIDTIIKNEIYIEIKVGTPKLTIPTYISLDQYSYYISGKNLSGIYNEDKSSSYQLKTDRESSYYKDMFEKGFLSSENIIMNDLKNKEFEIKDFNFVLPSKQGIKLYPSLIGLGIESYYMKTTGFLYQLKQKRIIDSYGWTIKYNNNDKGEIIFGGYPHEYDNNYNQINFKNAKAESRGSYINWDLYFDYIKWNNKIFNDSNGYILYAELIITNNTIIAPGFFMNIFQENVFKSNLCNAKIYDNKYYYFICNKNFKIKNFGSLFFYHKDFEYTFEISYKDLFIENNNEIYSLLFFSQIQLDRWSLGKPFFKKYQIIFEPDRKLIGFYVNKSNFSWSWIIVYLLGIIIIVLSIYMIYKYKKIPHRIKAKELDDNENDEKYSKLINEKSTLGI